MSVIEVLRFALSGLGANKARSALTTLGIVIGVGAVVLLIAVGNGSSRAVQQGIAALGTNTLTVIHGGGGFRGPGSSALSTGAKDLTLADADALAALPGVLSVAPVVSTQETFTYDGASTTASLTGSYPSYLGAENKTVSQGTAFTSFEETHAQKVLVLGATVAQDLFGGSVNPVGKTVVAGGIPFTVAGVLQATGSSGLSNADDLAIAPLSTVRQSLTGYGTLSDIVVEASSAAQVDPVQSEITALLDQRHEVTPASQDFQILNASSLLSTAESASHTFTVLLTAVAALSLLVGGIGITNIMLVTVTERTREIGIRKAIGARPGVILGQFLTEATLLSVAGGAAGVVAALIGSRFTIDGVKPAPELSSILLAFGVSAAIGLFFGGFPAHRAASMRPADALRHE